MLSKIQEMLVCLHNETEILSQSGELHQLIVYVVAEKTEYERRSINSLLMNLNLENLRERRIQLFKMVALLH